MSLCKFKNYADIFGKPNEGIHSTRIGGYAFVDILGTLIIAVLLSYYCNLNIFVMIVLIFMIGQLCHLLFCVDTAFVKNFITK